MPNSRHITAPKRDDQTGFGLGLRTTHYPDYFREKQPLDWLEIITDNFLGEGGKPLAVLDRIRQDYPLAMHGVAMSIGGTDPLDLAYLKQVKTLAQRIDPLWVSDHLCWTGHQHHRLHDLYPLPYTDEAARHVIDRISQAQDVLGRRLVIENVSSYIEFVVSAQTEWEFLHHVANEADCLLLLDINNIYVSSVNHNFDPLTYLQGLPGHRVQQIHLAGHTDNGDHLVDTHDQPVCEAVWQLYEKACQLLGPVATMIERDDDIPPLPTLLDELDKARQTRAKAVSFAPVLPTRPETTAIPKGPSASPALKAMQLQLTDYILGSDTEHPPAQAMVVETQPVGPLQRLGIYHHAYRARLVEALADSFARTERYAGSNSFAEWASDFAENSPPNSRSLNRYGHDFPEFLRQRFAHNPELFELAQLDWDLRSRFDMADAPTLDKAQAAERPPESWLHAKEPLHPTVLLRTIQTNVVSLWQALDADDEVPLAQSLPEPMCLIVWRLEHQPHFHTVSSDQGVFMGLLAAGHSLQSASDAMGESTDLSANTLGHWFGDAFAQGWLRRCEAAAH